MLLTKHHFPKQQPNRKLRRIFVRVKTLNFRNSKEKFLPLFAKPFKTLKFDFNGSKRRFSVRVKTLHQTNDESASCVGWFVPLSPDFEGSLF